MTYLFKINKHTKNIQVSKAASSIKRLLASQDIYNVNSLNIEVQKQNET